MSAESLKLLNQRYSALVNERSSWITHYEELSKFVLPRHGRYFGNNTNRGVKKHNAIYDNTGTKALRTLSAGMMSGLTNQSSPWFALSIADRDMMEYQPVKMWLKDVTEILQDIFARSNTYRVLQSLYTELGLFGTGAALIETDFNRVIHLHQFTAGEYCIATDFKGDVITLYREIEKTVGELVREFGFDNCSVSVQQSFKRGNLDLYIPIRHAIEPRDDREKGAIGAKNMPWKSIYWEASSGDGKLLRESGFETFPCVCPRWEALGGDVYGSSPGMDALGDIKQLQAQQFRKSQAIDYQANPPLQVPSAMKNREVQTFPGGISYYDASAGTQGIKTAFEVNLNLQYLLADIQDVRTRINGAFYADIFAMISQNNGTKTAFEVAQMREEKMTLLGPVVGRLNNELLDKLVSATFERAITGSLLPPPPEQLQGQDLNIEYTSILSMAQKSIGVNGIDRFVTTIGQIAMIKPDVLDKFDSDNWADIYSQKIGVDPELIVPGEQVAMIRQQRAEAQQKAEQQESMMQGSQMASNLGNISTGEGSMGGVMMKRLNG